VHGSADVSVVLPCFNREDRVGEALRSVLDQSPRPCEVLVVDDGSTDRSAAVAASFGPPVRVLRTPNRGPSAARNLGLQEARGRWVAFIDSDDRWLPSKLAYQLEAFSRYPEADVVFCDTEIWRSNRPATARRFALGGVYEAVAHREGPFLRFDRSLFRHLLTSSRIFPSAVLARRGLEGLRFPSDLRHAEDWGLWLRLSLSATFVAIDCPLVRMNYGSDNLSSQYGDVLLGAARVLEELLDDTRLAEGERQSVRRELLVRRRKAVYQLLSERRHPEARRLLRQLAPGELGRLEWTRYWIRSLLPARLQSKSSMRPREPAGGTSE